MTRTGGRVRNPYHTTHFHKFAGMFVVNSQKWTNTLCKQRMLKGNLTRNIRLVTCGECRDWYIHRGTHHASSYQGNQAP